MPPKGAFSVWHYEHRFPICPLDYPDHPRPGARRARRGRPDAHAELLAVARAAARHGRRRHRSAAAHFPRRRGAEAPARRTRRRPRRASREAIERAVALLNGTPGTARQLRDAAPHARGAGLPARPLARGGERHQLSPLLRHQRPRRAARRGSGRLRPHARDWCSASSARAASRACASTTSTASPTPRATRARCRRRSGRASTSSSRRSSSRASAAALAGRRAPPATTRSNLHRRRCSSTPTRRTRSSALYRRATGLDERLRRRCCAPPRPRCWRSSFASELEVLVSDLKRIADADRRTRDFTVNALRRALVEIIARFPVYRSYLGDGRARRRRIVAPDRGRGREGEAPAARCRTARVHDFVARGAARRRRDRRARPPGRRAGRAASAAGSSSSPAR